MSNPEHREQHSRRLYKDEVAIKRQVKIAKNHKLDEFSPREPIEPHRYHKHHAMNCGNPKCVYCGNPRKVFNEKTIQEKKFQQEYEDYEPNQQPSGSIED